MSSGDAAPQLTTDSEGTWIAVWHSSVDELDARILPDMGVKVTFLEEAAMDTTSVESGAIARIPESAVNGSANGTYAFVLTGNVVERRAIRVAAASRGSVPVLTGLEPGERVVIGAEGITDGMEVRTE